MKMTHPLEFLPLNLRKPLFFTLLALTIVLFAVLGVLDQPLRTPAAPNGIVSFELAQTPERAACIISSWDEQARLAAALGLGIDYLFMPAYSLALALGILLAANRHSNWVKSLGAAAGWGALAAAVFDAIENYALWQVLTGEVQSMYPLIAMLCAQIKFSLIPLGSLYALSAWLMPKRS